MWLILVLPAVFISVQTLAVLDLMLEDLSWRVNSEESRFSLLHKSSSPLSTMIDITETTSMKCVFYLHNPSGFYPEYNKCLQELFCFHFPHFYFPQNFVVLQKNVPQPTVPWCYALMGHKHRELCDSSGSNLKERKPPFWISVNLSDNFKAWMKKNKQSFCRTISKRENDGTQTIISYMIFDQGKCEFQLRY